MEKILLVRPEREAISCDEVHQKTRATPKHDSGSMGYNGVGEIADGSREKRAEPCRRYCSRSEGSTGLKTRGLGRLGKERKRKGLKA